MINIMKSQEATIIMRGMAHWRRLSTESIEFVGTMRGKQLDYRLTPTDKRHLAHLEKELNKIWRVM